VGDDHVVVGREVSWYADLGIFKHPAIGAKDVVTSGFD
jgi:hypothetical protein